MFQVSCIDAGNGQEIFSFSHGGAADHLLAGGCKEQVSHRDKRLCFFLLLNVLKECTLRKDQF